MFSRLATTDLWLGLVVLRHQDQLVARSLKACSLLPPRVAADFDVLAEGSLLAGERRLHGDLDLTLLRQAVARRGAGCQ